MRHYNTVVLPEALYAVETTQIGGQTKIKEMEKQERKILRKIFGPIQEQGIWKKRPTSEIYKYTDKITDTIRKRRMQFYGHIHKMNENRISQRILKVINSGRGKQNG